MFGNLDHHPGVFRRINLLLSLVAVLLLLILVATSPASAGNTTFLTDKNGNIVFPFSPPNRATGGPGAIDNTVIGATTPQNVTGKAIVGDTLSGVVTNTSPTPITQGAPNAQTVSATLTAANLATGIITVNQGGAGASALQLPLATAMDTAFPASVAGSAFDFSVINISTVAAEAASLTTNTGWTLVGDTDVAANSAITTKSAGRFRARKTGTGAWVLYRLS